MLKQTIAYWCGGGYEPIYLNIRKIKDYIFDVICISSIICWES